MDDLLNEFNNYEFIDYDLDRETFINGSIQWLNNFLKNSNLMNISGIGGI